ncbi:DUF692 domain-containing protein [Devosia sp. CN2-171]|uniref:DUF692 domain-containing protein n=1 Tax=Devosia sp. CN2-171 TaxID=3400909 RepID=UPI003BF8DDD0
MDGLPQLGVGVSYRRSFAADVWQHSGSINVLEIVADNVPRLLTREVVGSLAAQFPIICHSLNISVGSDESLDLEYVDRIARIVGDLGAAWLGDHLALTRIAGRRVGHLAPLCFSNQSVDIVARNVEMFRQRTGLTLILENITYYFSVPGGHMTEWEFIRRVCEASGCGLLLDLNNLHINSVNHGYDPYEFLEGIPLQNVVQVHLAGSRRKEQILVDSHADPVSQEVWRLLEWLRLRCRPNAVILEWDRAFPPFAVIVAEVEKARGILTRR